MNTLFVYFVASYCFIKDTGAKILAYIWLRLVLDGESSYRQAVLIGLETVPNRYPEPGAKVF